MQTLRRLQMISYSKLYPYALAWARHQECLEQLTMARDSLIYLLQGLGLLIITNKSVLQPCQAVEFLGAKMNSKDLVLALS